jgi:hypothetical protein
MRDLRRQEEGRKGRSTTSAKAKAKRRKETEARSKMGSSKNKKKKKKKKRSRREEEAEEEASSDASSQTSGSYQRRRERKRRRKEGRKKESRKDPKKESRKDPKKSRRRERKDASDDKDGDPMSRNYLLAEALQQLLDGHPAFAADLPVILIRLAGGTTFDLRHMQPAGAAQGLANVLQCLVPFGVTQQAGDGAWTWQSPTGASHNNRNELVLVKLVRAMLDQMGLSLEAVRDWERPKKTVEEPIGMTATATAKTNASKRASQLASSSLEDMVKRTLDSFAGSLGGELAGLCRMILEGESIALDGLPDANLQAALKDIFETCGLVQTEMEPDEEEDTIDTRQEPPMGYALSEDLGPSSMEKLQRVVHVCKTVAARPPIKGPLRPPTHYQARPEESDDEDNDVGPSIIPRGSQEEISASAIEAQAARRQRELSSVQAGQGPLGAEDDSGREEWMLAPGKSDFFDFIKRGEPIKARKFTGKASTDDDIALVDPSVKAEMDAIYKAHHAARGPSLMEAHQAAAHDKKAQEAVADGSTQSWNWNRNEDLDKGRRVDTNALEMVFGGAASGLKSKFQGSFRGGQ